MARAAAVVDAEPMMVFANESLTAQAKLLVPEVADWDLRIGGLHQALGKPMWPLLPPEPLRSNAPGFRVLR